MHRATGFHHQPRQQGILFRRKIQRRFTQPHQRRVTLRRRLPTLISLSPGCYAGGRGANARIEFLRGKGFYR